MNTTTPMLARKRLADLPRLRRSLIDAETLAQAGAIVEDVRTRGEVAVREHGERLGDLQAGGELVIDRVQLDAARARIGSDEAALLERVAGRITRFAEAQRASIGEAAVELAGGRAWQEVRPVERAGCYAPGGRYPLVSSVLMTVCTARSAGVADVTLATPGPSSIMLAAAAIAGADRVLAVGGPQAIAGLAFGIGDGLEAVDAIVGPGNRWVTAAKQLVSGVVSIDMLAGPSELLILADDSADAGTLAADLLAQAEHDTDASAVLACTDAGLMESVDRELRAQLEDLPTAETARSALERNSFGVVVSSVDELVSVADAIASEHLEVHTRDAEAVSARCAHAGGVFVGGSSAEVFGDYGAGPNHTLPTGGSARSFAGLSVFDFLRVRTSLRMDDLVAARGLVEDTAALARQERLEGHARSAERRLG